MRKFLSLLLTMAMVFSLAVTVNAAAPKEDITILHTNDVHCDYEKYAKVATLHKSADLLVDAGDHVQGGVIGTLSKGEYIVDIMNYLKYDAAVPGNHEFDYGMDQFLHIAKDLAKYPYISANFTGKDGKPYFDAYKMFEVKGVKVAFVGVCTPETCGGFNYRRASRETLDPCLQQLLLAFSQDEYRHANAMLCLLSGVM